MIQPLTKVLLAGGSALVVAGAALSISPVYHNFGDVAVLGLTTKAFQVTLPPGSARGITLTFSIIGPDAVDFLIGPDAGGDLVRPTVDPFDPNSPCPAGAQGVVCTKHVEFRPRSLGPKKATLVVKDGRGSSNSATLEGIGVAPLCTHTVVPCNYALHFSGVFGWNYTVAGPASKYTENVNVDVVNGVAACNGSATQSGEGRTYTGVIVGTGLIGVEFLPDPLYPWVYQITAACPTPAWPAKDDQEATPSQPAELGQGEQSSDKQPVGRKGMLLEEAIASVTKLDGVISMPTNDTDPANGVTGTVTVTWHLCPNSLYQSPDRRAGSLRQGRCP
jgi:hypothetical protein